MLPKYTREELEAMPRKGDVAEVANSLNLSADGTRAEITDRILDYYMATFEEFKEADSGGSGNSEDAAVAADSDDDASEDAATDAGVIDPAAIDAALAALPGFSLSAAARTEAKSIVAAYLGVEDTAPEMPAVYDAIAAGVQPCVVEGKGNRRFAVEVFNVPFEISDPSKDIKEGTNILRHLESKGLLARG